MITLTRKSYNPATGQPDEYSSTLFLRKRLKIKNNTMTE
jgi:hypothetical protein